MKQKIPMVDVSLLTKRPSSHKMLSIFQQPIFDLAFRSFFLLAPAFAAISLALWIATLHGWFNFNTDGLSALIWHIHEMIFGFAATIAVAFILTAVQTWTGTRSVNGAPLAALILLWLAIRITLLLNTQYAIYSAVVLQTIWWIALISIYSHIVICAKNRRNYLFIPILCLMAVLNLWVLMADLLGNTALALHLSRSMILVFTLLMAIVGNRVIPFFTQRGANTAAINTPKWLSGLLTLISILTIAVFTGGYFFALPIEPPVLMIGASILHFMRLSYWRSHQTLAVPLLWSLHAAYLCMCVGLLLLGLSYYTIGLSFSSALHFITIGAISLMILAMISRVSLGHTGRPLKVNKVMKFAFMLMLGAAFIRSCLAFILYNSPLDFHPSIANPELITWDLSAALWITAMFIYLMVYWPILLGAKQTSNHNQ